MLQYTYCWILKAEGWAEVAITASVTDEGPLDDQSALKMFSVCKHLCIYCLNLPNFALILPAVCKRRLQCLQH